MEFTVLDPSVSGFWSVIPPLVAIILALATKEVISSLIIGILAGTAIYTCFMHQPVIMVLQNTVGLMAVKIGENASMVLFMALLGALVSVITSAGGSKAYGEWAFRKLKGKRYASLMTALLGIIIFIDDYFNALTIGTVMRPVTDKFKISREKLSYFIDSTAAPVCIIAPISSWAAAVSGFIEGEDGLFLFIKAIPMNLYALLTIFMVFWIAFRQKGDYGPMAAAERAAAAADSPGDLEDVELDENAMADVSEKGHVLDLVLPILFLFAFSILSMLYYGGFWEVPEGGETRSFVRQLSDAFGNTSAGPALALAGMCSIFVAFLQFVPRRVLSFHDFFDALTRGVKTMVPALIILTLAWTISGVCRDMLNTGEVVSHWVKMSKLSIGFVPVLLFVVAGALSFSTGTSWGTFGILIPIGLAISGAIDPTINNLVLSAILAGSVLGDHCSPISDTTILSSTGAGCFHINHVETQIPYALTTGAVCVIGYAIAGGLHESGLPYWSVTGISWAITFGLLTVLLIVLPIVWKGRRYEYPVVRKHRHNA